MNWPKAASRTAAAPKWCGRSISMSRAEAQLNDGRAEEALVLERQALASLERALDRRRYFLRTLPDRSRIDTTRRLTADRREARSWVRDRAAGAAPSSIERQRDVMRALVSAAAGTSAVDASLAARVAAIDPASPELQKAAVGIASARSAEERSGAIQTAMHAVTTHALNTLPAAAVVTMPADPLAGRLADSRKPPMNGRWLRGSLRGIAIVIAVAALVDPVLSIDRAPAIPLTLIKMTASDVAPIEREVRRVNSGAEVHLREVVHHRLPCGPGERCVVIADGSVDAELPPDLDQPLSLIRVGISAGPNVRLRSVVLAAGQHASAAGVAR